MSISDAARIVPLTEIARSGTLRVDREAGVIYGVKVLGLVSANGRRYTQAAVEAARPLYEGAPVNFDHPPAARPEERRRWGERLGRLQNVRATEAGLFADLHYLKSHPMAEMTVEAAERMPEALGLSHNAVGRIVQRQQETIVEEIMQVRSVDVVSDPATTKSLFESEVGGQGAGVGSQGSEVRVAELQEELAVLRRREEVREQLETAGIAADAAMVRALALVESAEARETLIEAWPRGQRGGVSPQSQSPRGEVGGTGLARVDLEKPQDVAAFLRGM